MRYWLLALAVGLSSVASAESAPVPLDQFAGSTTAARQTPWVAREGTPSPRREDGRFVVSAPFESRPALRRAVIDREVGPTDMAAGDASSLVASIARADEFLLELEADSPAAIAHVNLYFHAGDGWYAAHGTIDAAGPRVLVFRKADFRTEGSPSAWDEVDRIRLAFWRAAPNDGEVRLHALSARRFPVGVLQFAKGDGSEAAASRRETAATLDSLRAAGIRAAALREADLDLLSCDTRPLVIVPYGPRWSDEATDALVDYVEEGGRVIAFYTAPPALLRAIGMADARYVKPEPGTLAEVRFSASDLKGLPDAMRQASWNMTAVEPAGHAARILGTWFDEAGRDTGLPALVVSDRGAFFTHILLPGDEAKKQQFLVSICGHFVPSLWPEITAEAARSWRQVGRAYPESDPQAAIQRAIEHAEAADTQRTRRLRAALDGALALEAAALDATADADYPAAIESYRRARARLTEAYLLALPSRTTEARAWWNHSGTGAYPGDWDRTMREAAAANFNMVLPNLLWGGVAHYPSDILPRSRTFETHGDQVAACVEAGRRHGVEVHVWKVNWNLSNAPRDFVRRLRDDARTQVDADGAPIDWLCPSHPANQELERASMLEVARRYDVDGLHFDYIRYPGSHVCFCDGCRARFERAIGRTVADWPADCRTGPLHRAYNDWRCAQITDLVAAVSTEARRIRPGIAISAAVFGGYPACRESVAQDWPLWIERGYLDFVCPMDYTESDAAFYGLIANQKRLVAGRIPIYPGIGLSASRSTLAVDRVAGQIQITRELEVGGFTLFNLSESTARDVLPHLGLGPTRQRAAVPHE